MAHAQNSRIAVEPHACRSADENDRRIRISAEHACDLVAIEARARGEQHCDIAFAILIGELDHHIIDGDKAVLQVVFEIFKRAMCHGISSQDCPAGIMPHQFHRSG
jgi:hypothetical protein